MLVKSIVLQAGGSIFANLECPMSGQDVLNMSGVSANSQICWFHSNARFVRHRNRLKGESRIGMV